MPPPGPYRSSARRAAVDSAPEPSFETPLTPVLLTGFAAATFRVVSAVLSREEFTAEPTLALLGAAVLAAVIVARVSRRLRARDATRAT